MSSPPQPSISAETQAIRDRYSKRHDDSDPRYDPLQPWMYMMQQERDRAWIRWIQEANLTPLHEKRLLEVGCGIGDNLVRALMLGFEATHLTGIELMPDRMERARARLPQGAELLLTDALEAVVPKNHYDVVLQSMVFSSVLDEGFRARLAARMWEWVKPGGGILWYDFTYGNPQNPDVRGMTLRDARQLFPSKNMKAWRITLAPPLARWFTRIHPVAYSVLNAVPWFRTHLLIWIRKER
jgi:SAM-dependent methyltransferase